MAKSIVDRNGCVWKQSILQPNGVQDIRDTAADAAQQIIVEATMTILNLALLVAPVPGLLVAVVALLLVALDDAVAARHVQRRLRSLGDIHIVVQDPLRGGETLLVGDVNKLPVRILGVIIGDVHVISTHQGRPLVLAKLVRISQHAQIFGIYFEDRHTGDVGSVEELKLIIVGVKGRPRAKRAFAKRKRNSVCFGDFDGPRAIQRFSIQIASKRRQRTRRSRQHLIQGTVKRLVPTTLILRIIMCIR